jgi:uncharacterized protein (DUF433 family)
MTLVIAMDSPPLAVDANGTVRVGGTRVTLDTVVGAFRAGETVDQIAEQYPAVTLADIYAAVSYYLRHRESVESYLVDRQRKAEGVRRTLEAEHPPEGRRQMLESRTPRKEPSP